LSDPQNIVTAFRARTAKKHVTLIAAFCNHWREIDDFAPSMTIDAKNPVQQTFPGFFGKRIPVNSRHLFVGHGSQPGNLNASGRYRIIPRKHSAEIFERAKTIPAESSFNAVAFANCRKAGQHESAALAPTRNAVNAAQAEESVGQIKDVSSLICVVNADELVEAIQTHFSIAMIANSAAAARIPSGLN
jgi:hypothetical protein